MTAQFLHRSQVIKKELSDAKEDRFGVKDLEVAYSSGVYSA